MKNNKLSSKRIRITEIKACNDCKYGVENWFGNGIICLKKDNPDKDIIYSVNKFPACCPMS